MPATIHPTAIIDPKAELGAAVMVGPYAVIGAGVKLGEGCTVGPHCLIEGPTVLGPENRLVSHVAMGGPPQDLKYAGEPTELHIGARNTFHPFSTFNRATVQGGGKTVIGDGNLFMTQAHVAHDCKVGDGNIFANAGTLAGHVTVGNFTTIGAYSAVHQFCRVGDYAFIGGFTVVTRDALPFMKTVGSRGDAKSFGPNRVGLERRGFSKVDTEALVLAHKRLLAGDELFADKLARVDQELGSNPKVAELLAFIRATQRGIILG